MHDVPEIPTDDDVTFVHGSESDVKRVLLPLRREDTGAWVDNTYEKAQNLNAEFGVHK